MTTEQLLEQIAKRGLLTSEQMARVRGSVAKSTTPVSPKALAKHLVDKGMLTQAQAQSLLKPPPPAAAPKPAEDEFGLAPLDELQPLAEELDELEELEGLVPLEPVQPAPKKPAAKPAAPAAKKPAAKPASATQAKESSLLEELVELEPAGMAGGNPLDLLSASAALGAEGNPLLAPPKKKGFGSLFGSKEPKKFKKGESEWESPLMLFGGGALLLLLIVGGGVFFLYLRGSGDQQFKAAEEDYRGGSYTQAIAKYTTYIDKNPKHPSLSLAKVHRGLARLRQATQAGDFSHALKEAQAVVTEIQNEKEFSEARLEFRSIFPDIAEGLAKEAAKLKDAAAVEAKLAETDEALKLVMTVNYIPESQRPTQRIATIQEIMAVAKREVEREAELATTLAAMKASSGKTEIATAYAARKKLLKSYPDLITNEALAAAVLAVADSEKGAVQVSTEKQPAQTKEPASPIVAQVALAARSAGDGLGSGPPVALLVQGAVYGFDSGSGKLLWRRYVGLDSPTPPVSVDAAEGADVLVIDAARNELARIAAATGKLVWRQPIGERIAGVCVSGKQAVVSTLAGKLVGIDVKSGAIERAATLPQGLRLIAATNPTLGRLYQVGDQSTIYVLSGDLACQQAFYLGHETGTVNVPPLVLPKHLIVIENRASKSCTLHALTVAEDGKIAKDVQKLDLPGHVLTTPVVADRKLVVMTDGGHIKVMGINASNTDQPLADLAEQPAASNEKQMLRHLLFDSGNLWIADKRLVRYKVQSAAGRLMPSPLVDDYDDASFEQPLVVAGKTLIHARRPERSATVLVTGTSMDDGRRQWETQVATPPAGEPIANGGVAVATASGQLFSLDADALQQPALDQPFSKSFATEAPIVLAARTDLADGNVVFAPLAGDTRMLLATAASARTGRLLTAPDKLACPPAALGKGLIVPTSIGQVFWLNPATGKPVAAPFQPSVSAGSEVQWTTPDSTSDGKELIISDGPRVYRVVLVREGSPHLEPAATSEDLAQPLKTPIAVLDAIAVGADDAGQLRVFKLPELTTDAGIDLGGSVTWGPRKIGKHILLSTANEELICFDGDAKIVWRQSLAQGPLAGTPAASDEELIISTLSGHVARLAIADGKTLGVTALGQPLATGPVPFEKHWLLVTKDGTLLIVNPPADGDASSESAKAE